MNELPHTRRQRRRLVWKLMVVVVFCGMACLYQDSLQQSRESAMIEDARAINLMLFQYAQDNNGQYPDGRTSTEVFQKLIDGGYAGNDAEGTRQGAALFYEPLPGKVVARSNHLKPENVAWDLTQPLDYFGADELPIIILTGYRISYTKGVPAVPRKSPPRSWWDWMHDIDYPRDYAVVGLKADIEYLRKAAPGESTIYLSDPDFVPRSDRYHQLTPDGSAP